MPNNIHSEGLAFAASEAVSERSELTAGGLAKAAEG